MKGYLNFVVYFTVLFLEYSAQANEEQKMDLCKMRLPPDYYKDLPEMKEKFDKCFHVSLLWVYWLSWIWRKNISYLSFFKGLADQNNIKIVSECSAKHSFESKAG